MRQECTTKDRGHDIRNSIGGLGPSMMYVLEIAAMILRQEIAAMILRQEIAAMILRQEIAAMVLRQEIAAMVLRQERQLGCSRESAKVFPGRHNMYKIGNEHMRGTLKVERFGQKVKQSRLR